MRVANRKDCQRFFVARSESQCKRFDRAQHLGHCLKQLGLLQLLDQLLLVDGRQLFHVDRFAERGEPGYQLVRVGDDDHQGGVIRNVFEDVFQWRRLPGRR